MPATLAARFPAAAGVAAICGASLLSAPAFASPLPALERDGGATSASLGAFPAASFDVRIASGVMLGAAAVTTASLMFPDGTRDWFGAMRLTHRLWTGPGGSAVGYLIGAGWKEVRGAAAPGDVDSRLEVMGAVVGSLVLVSEPGVTIRCRASYGPALVPYDTSRRAPFLGVDPEGGLEFGDVPTSFGGWQTAPAVVWAVNPEVSFAFPNNLEVVYGLFTGIGLRYLW